MAVESPAPLALGQLELQELESVLHRQTDFLPVRSPVVLLELQRHRMDLPLAAELRPVAWPQE